MKKITAEELKVFSQYIYEISGIVLDKSKGYLIETRLRPLMSELKSETFSELFYKVKSDSSGTLKHQIVDAISTNETFFFRDNKPFDLLRNKILPDLIDRRCQQYRSSPTPLKIWSAACSSGQEVYSIAITLKEMLPDLHAYNIHILGSDISDKIIAQASYGKYNRFEVERGLPKQYLHRYFNQIGNEWRIKDEIRAMAQFNKTNLLKPFAGIGTFDIVFCRNVAIYFSQADRQKLFNNLAQVLAPDGALLLGGSESLSGIQSPFESRNYLRAIYYQKKGWDTVALGSPPVASGARQAAPPSKPVSRPTKPGAAQQSPPKPGPAVPSLKPSFQARRPIPQVPDAPARSFAPAEKKEKKRTGPAQPQDLLPEKQPPELKKSLLSAIYEKKRAGSKPLFGNRRADDGAHHNSKEEKRSLLEKIAASAKKKGK